MSVFSRFGRWIRALFGGAISAVESPRLILEQNIRDLNDQVPRMNENIATVKANVILMQKELARLERKVLTLEDQLRAAISSARNDVAEDRALALDDHGLAVARAKEQLALAESAYEKAVQVKSAFMAEKERKIREAREALRDHERAQWQAKVASAFEQFEIAGADQTHQEMLDRVREETARNEARLEMALDTARVDEQELEEDARSLRAKELIARYAREMGQEVTQAGASTGAAATAKVSDVAAVDENADVEVDAADGSEDASGDDSAPEVAQRTMGRLRSE